MNILEIKNILKENGLKSTIQRTAIFDILTKSRRHLSADEIFREVTEKYPGLSLSTVYNTLELFVKNQIVCKVTSDTGLVKYDAMLDNHHHLLCENTKTITDFYDDELDDILKNYFDKKGIPNFNINSIQLNIKGYFLNNDMED